jgi:plasmid stabilization system protein ParE
LDLPFLPEARREFLEAVDRYESTSAGLGGEFVTDVEDVLSRIRVFPRHGSPSAGGVRRISLRRFPFSIVYLEGREGILIVAVAHQRRSPFYWQDRV